VVVEDETAEAPRGLCGRQRGQPPLGLVEVDDGRNVHVGHAVAVGHEERTVADVGRTRFNRPPVSVSRPVSMSVTRQGSDVFWCTVT